MFVISRISKRVSHDTPKDTPTTWDLLLIATLTIKAQATGIISQWPLSFGGFFNFSRTAL
jgi:hypothetical protein